MELQNILLNECGVIENSSQRMWNYVSFFSKNVGLLKILLKECGIIEGFSRRMWDY